MVVYVLVVVRFVIDRRRVRVRDFTVKRPNHFTFSVGVKITVTCKFYMIHHASEKSQVCHMFTHTLGSTHHSSDFGVRVQSRSHLCRVPAPTWVKGGGVRSRPALSAQRAPRTDAASKNLRRRNEEAHVGQG